MPEQSNDLMLTTMVLPGKTAPLLIENLCRYDPLHPSRTGHHILAHAVTAVEHGRALQPPEANPEACPHKWILKPEQTNLLPHDDLAEGGSCQVVAALCRDCRIHVALRLESRSTSKSKTGPCPNQDFPLHHFRYDTLVSQSRRASEAQGEEGWTETHCFRCSSPTCAAVATLVYTPARLTSSHLTMLLNREVIKSRVQPVLDAEPDRLRDYTVPDSIRVMATLKTYLSDAMRDTERKKVNSFNKRFMTTLGDTCTDMLQWLGFEYFDRPSEVSLTSSSSYSSLGRASRLMKVLRSPLNTGYCRR